MGRKSKYAEHFEIGWIHLQLNCYIVIMVKLSLMRIKKSMLLKMRQMSCLLLKNYKQNWTKCQMTMLLLPRNCLFKPLSKKKWTSFKVLMKEAKIWICCTWFCKILALLQWHLKGHFSILMILWPKRGPILVTKPCLNYSYFCANKTWKWSPFLHRT